MFKGECETVYGEIMFCKSVVGMFKGECETVCGEIMFHKCVVGMFTSESETLYNVPVSYTHLTLPTMSPV